MEVHQQPGALGLFSKPCSGGILQSDLLNTSSHIWMIEETKFAYRTMVQRMYCHNTFTYFKPHILVILHYTQFYLIIIVII